MTEHEKEAFIGGVEFAIDWRMDIPPEDFELYNKLIEERAEREAKRREQGHIDGEVDERPRNTVHTKE